MRVFGLTLWGIYSTLGQSCFQDNKTPRHLPKKLEEVIDSFLSVENRSNEFKQFVIFTKKTYASCFEI